MSVSRLSDVWPLSRKLGRSRFISRQSCIRIRTTRHRKRSRQYHRPTSDHL